MRLRNAGSKEQLVRRLEDVVKEVDKIQTGFMDVGDNVVSQELAKAWERLRSAEIYAKT